MNESKRDISSAELQYLAVKAHEDFLLNQVGPSLGKPVEPAPLQLLTAERNRIQHLINETKRYNKHNQETIDTNNALIEKLSLRLKAYDDAIIPLLPENQRPGRGAA